MSVVPHKMSDGSGVEKETVAQEKAGLLFAEQPLSNAPDSDSLVGDRSRLHRGKRLSEVSRCIGNSAHDLSAPDHQGIGCRDGEGLTLSRRASEKWLRLVL
ncbi:hypothetical protein HYPDE_27583 [Hyphomicrobium denitrificans 1NES1]|uniref:Uncharacterized protein n=1 Tax=Hyphomicrobium denitrificans 1NES1 TaxID=670307 RepID=N0B9I6_9HYPH|nr:hypothetical protein HYPDE_27583 [Hyphomicrobium denitrificans 1NES1]